MRDKNLREVEAAPSRGEEDEKGRCPSERAKPRTVWEKSCCFGGGFLAQPGTRLLSAGPLQPQSRRRRPREPLPVCGGPVRPCGSEAAGGRREVGAVALPLRLFSVSVPGGLSAAAVSSGLHSWQALLARKRLGTTSAQDERVRQESCSRCREDRRGRLGWGGCSTGFIFF